MKSPVVRLGMLALLLFGMALGFSYTVTTQIAQAAEECNCVTHEGCPPSCNRGGNSPDPEDPLAPCYDIGGWCSVCKCW